MIENVWCVLCKDIVTDSQTNLISYLNCFEGISVSKLPGNLLPFSIGTLWIKDSDEVEVLKVRVRSFTPSGTEKELFESQDMEMKKKKHRFNLVIEGFSVNEEGTYKFMVEYYNKEKWEVVKKLQLGVNISKKLDNQANVGKA